MTATVKKMPYVRLGNSGLKISRIILGTMQYGSKEWQGWVLGEEEGIAHIKEAYDLGIQTFDTANVYSNGLSETILGNAIKKHKLPREEIVVMTKLYYTMARGFGETSKDWSLTHDYVNQKGLSRKHIFDSVKQSLERLGLDYIDVLQCHAWDEETPIEETMHALHDVVKAGWVRYIGMSTCKAYQFHAMQNYAITNKLTPFISLQNHYSLLFREDEREMMPTLKMFGVGAIPWSPLSRGLLAKPVGASSLRADTDKVLGYFTRGAYEEIINRVEEISKKRGISMAQVATAWLLSKPGVTAPIVGSTKLENLKDIVGALDVQLTEDEVKYLEEKYEPLPPH
ncbi:Aldo keto reductase [Coniophora puteana RWD-64-598 SS2]|uniref:Aldo keto reductase n=1 Tax=Coniophora puteana (strain RWD-64-598) TaxID=741705 RepID=A0A5M3MPL8_CONPW|nr:Aldo keto reductase [Coniophora puteana RWD-64-598 SS2]EIW80654.1 Aldo keto reductase [Coniophora puteana RWD-64-598 SS2]